MVSDTHMDGGLVTDIRLSTVVPGRMTPGNTVHELTSMDLAMKLHYLKAVYFFKTEAVQGLTITELKKSMFNLLNVYCHVAGRIRRSEEDGRPLIKCNDGGVRVVEARANKTVEEWLQMDVNSALDHYLIYNHVLGPDLAFSPLVFVQFTWFRCGGLSLGLSWAHVLGDPFSASQLINTWTQIIAGDMPIQSSSFSNNGNKFHFPSLIQPEKPIPMKKVDPVGDYWLSNNNRTMESHSFPVTALSESENTFQALSALIWKCLAKIRRGRGESEPIVVTICTSDSKERENGTVGNNQMISTVEAGFNIAEADSKELVRLIAEKSLDERGMMEKMDEKSDYIVYGANLTFVNLEGVGMYEVKLKGKRVVYANYSMVGVGDEGVVLILPGPGGENERQVTVVLPEGEGLELKNEMERELGTITK